MRILPRPSGESAQSRPPGRLHRAWERGRAAQGSAAGRRVHDEAHHYGIYRRQIMKERLDVLLVKRNLAG